MSRARPVQIPVPWNAPVSNRCKMCFSRLFNSIPMTISLYRWKVETMQAAVRPNCFQPNPPACFSWQMPRAFHRRQYPFVASPPSGSPAPRITMLSPIYRPPRRHRQAVPHNVKQRYAVICQLEQPAPPSMQEAKLWGKAPCCAVNSGW